MSATPASRPDIVAALRAAGCVFAEDEAKLLLSTAPSEADLTVMVGRRASGEPLEHILGWARFCGLRIAVDPGVFVPRRRTEFLVRQGVALVHHGVVGPVGRAQGRSPARRRAVVVDLCCGSGAVGAALAEALDEVELHAVDIDPVAVRCARRNVPAGAQVYEGDLYDPLPTTLQGRVDVVIANVPYVPTEEIGLLPTEARRHEPQVALDGGADGLHVVRRMISAVPPWLAPGGHLLVETSEYQAVAAVETIARAGLTPRVSHSDELSATVVIGARTAPGPLAGA